MKMKKQWIILVLVIISLMFFLNSVSAEKKIVVGVSCVNKDNQWWATVGNFVEQSADVLGCEVIILWANADQEKQVKDIEDLIQRKVDVILMAPVQKEGSSVAIEEAYAAGIPVVLFVRRTADSSMDKVAAGVLHDYVSFGVKQAQQVAKDFPNGANIVYLLGPLGATYAMDQYDLGFTVELKKYPNLKLIETYHSPTDTSAEGMKLTEDALVRFDNVDAICCPNDDLALGAIRAAESAGKLDKIKIYGNSGVIPGLQAVYDGKMAFTEMESQSQVAFGGLETAVKVVKGETVPKEVLLEAEVITKANVLLIKDAVFGGTIANPETFKPKTE
jgi:ABC-type sugar transport system substrate-binding protein